MAELILIGALLVALAVAAQIRRGRIAPPAPVADRVRVVVDAASDGVTVSFTGVPGLVLSFHRVTWAAGVEVVEVSGPRTLVGRRDVRRYRLGPGSAGDVRIRHVWEQLTLREFELTVQVPARETGGEDTAEASMEGAA
jgi:hypothetical protein